MRDEYISKRASAIASFDLPAPPAAVQKSIGQCTCDMCIQIRSDVHLPALFCTGAGGAGKCWNFRQRHRLASAETPRARGELNFVPQRPDAPEEINSRGSQDGQNESRNGRER